MGDLISINVEKEFHGGKSWMDEGLYLSEALKIVPNRYLLVKIISDRVKQLTRGAKPLIDIEDSQSLSLLEIACKELVQGELRLENSAQEPKKIKKKKETQEI
jgi:DNA-directed RNA polymerase subunit omega